jgi:hypothetical protein
VLEASVRSTRRAFTTFPAKFVADFAFCLLALASGCQGEITGDGEGFGAGNSAAGSGATSAAGATTTSTPVDLGDVIGVDPQQLRPTVVSRVFRTTSTIER